LLDYPHVQVAPRQQNSSTLNTVAATAVLPNPALFIDSSCHDP